MFSGLTILNNLRHGRGRRWAAIFVGVIALAGWVALGSKVIASLNPSLKHELSIAMHPALDVWIAPPEYAGTAPVIISTPAGVRFKHDTLTILQGSTISAHLAEQDGDAPELIVDGQSTPFTADSHGDFAATQSLTNGTKLSIRRGWMTLASWNIRVIADSAPKVALTEPPSITEGKSVRLSYTASDELGVTSIALRVTPHSPLPGADNSPVEISLPISQATQIARVDFEDMTAHPWAGQKVSLQLVATNETSKRGFSDPVDFTLPERSFFHPISRVLIEERKKLLLNPDDGKLRGEVANLMAGIAHEATSFHADPVVLMALRSGAVRLVLNQDHAAAVSVNDILWETATRIEDGSDGQARRMLHDARQDLANALTRNAGAEEIRMLTDSLQSAMARYMAHISARAVHRIVPPTAEAPAHGINASNGIRDN